MRLTFPPNMQTILATRSLFDASLALSAGWFITQLVGIAVFTPEAGMHEHEIAAHYQCAPVCSPPPESHTDKQDEHTIIMLIIRQHRGQSVASKSTRVECAESGSAVRDWRGLRRSGGGLHPWSGVRSAPSLLAPPTGSKRSDSSSSHSNQNVATLLPTVVSPFKLFNFGSNQLS